MPAPVAIEVRFWDHVIKGGDDDCWPWTASRTDLGYGRVNVKRRVEKAHRVAWTLAYGEIPPGLCVLHRCDNPPCVNPAHLFLGTQADNMQDMHAKGRGVVQPRKTHCPQNHPYDEANTQTDPRGKRHCRTCVRERARLRRAAR